MAGQQHAASNKLQPSSMRAARSQGEEKEKERMERLRDDSCMDSMHIRIQDISKLVSSAFQITNSVYIYTVAEKGYKTGEYAPGLKLGGSGAQNAAHHVTKVKFKLNFKLCEVRIFSRLIKLFVLLFKQKHSFVTMPVPTGTSNVFSG